MNIFVIGSKPHATYPHVDPDLVVTANGALKRAQPYKNLAPIVALITEGTLKLDNDETRATRTVLENCYVDELVIVQSSQTRRLPYLIDPSNLLDLAPAAKVKYIPPVQRTMAFLRLAQKKALNHLLHNCTVRQQLGFFWSLLTRSNCTAAKLSTGFLAIDYIYSRGKPRASYHLIGIGLEYGSAHFYSDSMKYSPNHQHIESDKVAFLNIRESNRLNLVTYDYTLKAPSNELNDQ